MRACLRNSSTQAQPVIAAATNARKEAVGPDLQITANPVMAVVAVDAIHANAKV